MWAGGGAEVNNLQGKLPSKATYNWQTMAIAEELRSAMSARCNCIGRGVIYCVGGVN